VIVALLVAALTQGGLEVTATVDRARLTLGTEFTLTVRARGRGPEAVELTLPTLAGLAVTGSREVSEVEAGDAGPVRATVRELTLRAERVGQVVIGPVVARLGNQRVRTAPITIQVDSAAAAAATALSPRARALLDGAVPATARQVSLSVVVSAESAFVGQQVDVLVVAWFPRALRDRLRRPPTLSLPAGAGAWVMPQPTSRGIAASRRAGGDVVDAFVLHHVLFPLTPGRITIPPASVSYALPLSFSFFSREERLTLTADSMAITVEALPADTGAAAAAAVGENVTVDVALSASTTRVGEPIEVTARVAGVGNVPLWTEPRIEWPPGFRAYPAGVRETIELRNGRVAGAKTFSAVVVPDSAGRFVVPDVRYAFYDLSTGRYREAVVPPRTLVVAPATGPRPARSVLRLMESNQGGWALRLTGILTPTQWAGLALLPPAVALLLRRRRSWPGATARPPAGRGLTPLGRLERDFDRVLAALVPEDSARYGAGLAPALRAAGIEEATADHVVRVRDRLRAARYGPRATGDAPALAAELRRVLMVLEGAPPARGRVRRTRALAGVLLMLLVRPGGAQTLSPDQLYRAGAWRAAVDSFAARAAQHPEVAAHWYNLGAALYGSGGDGEAVAAWTRAARLAPRNATIRRARGLVAAPDLATGDLLRVGLVTPSEWLTLAGLAWVALWLAVATRRQRRVMLALGALVLTSAVAGSVEWHRVHRPVAVVRRHATAVRAAPHGSASATGTVDAGAAVLTGRRYGRWIEVRRDDGLRGWVRDTEIVRL